MKIRIRIAAALRHLANRIYPATPRVLTVPGADWLNAIQGELRAAINAAGEKSPLPGLLPDHGGR
jgi:hypothetical protein